MATLRIHHHNGSIATCELSEHAPVLVGKLPSCEIQVDEPDLPAVHCRFMYRRGRLHIMAAGSPAVEVNGQQTQEVALEPGDRIRVGRTIIELLGSDGASAPGPAAGQAAPAAAPAEASTYWLAEPATAPVENVLFKPISEDEIRANPPWANKLEPHAPVATATSAPGSSVPPVPPAGGTSTKSRPAKESAKKADRPESVYEAEIIEEFDNILDGEIADPSIASQPVTKKPPEPPPVTGWRKLFASPSARPGEQDPLRSPLVLSLLVAAGVLLLSSLTLWTILSRNAANQLFETANRAFSDQLYAQAIPAFQEFLAAHPRHVSAEPARLMLAQAKVLQPLSGAVPDWEQGQKSLNDFLVQYRDTPDFQPDDSAERKFALRSAAMVAVGAAQAAGTARKKLLLDVSNEARQMLEAYSPLDQPPKEELKAIEEAQRVAQAAILKQDTFDSLAAKIDADLEAKRMVSAIGQLQELLDRYPDLTAYKPFRQRLDKTLALDTQLARRQESRRAATTTDPESDSLPALMFTRRTRVRSDENSLDEVVGVFADDSCFGIDTMTGEPKWRRPLAGSGSFGAVAVNVKVPAFLVCDRARNDLVLLEQKSGVQLWRQSLDKELPVGAPLVFGGQVYLATTGNRLLQVDLGTGELESAVQFAHALSGGLALSRSGERIFAVAEHGVLFSLSRRPLACIGAMFLGQAEGSVRAPLLSLRDFLLVVQNDRVRSCQLRLLNIAADDKPPTDVARLRLEGQVLHAPAVRGNRLFVGSIPERLTAVTIAEVPDEHALSIAAVYAAPKSAAKELFVTTGPDDQAWMAGSELRRFELAKNELRPSRQEVALGSCNQPLLLAGDALFVGKRAPYSRSVQFAKVERSKLEGVWQTAVGSDVLAVSGQASPDGAAAASSASVAALTSLGDLFTLSSPQWGRRGFELQPAAQIPVPEGAIDPLQATLLADGRLAVTCGRPKPHLWIVSASGALTGDYDLPGVPESPPALLGQSLAVPVTGRVCLIDLAQSGSVAGAGDLVAPIKGDAAPPRWMGIAAAPNQQAIVTVATGSVLRVELRTEPALGLVEVASWNAPAPVDLPPCVAGETVAVADTAGRLSLLTVKSLEVTATAALGAPAAQPIYLCGKLYLVNVGRSVLKAYTADTLQLAWEKPLPHTALAGQPAIDNGRLIVALQDGTIWLLDSGSGKLLAERNLGERLCLAPRKIAGAWVVGVLDGGLVSIEPWLKEAAP